MLAIMPMVAFGTFVVVAYYAFMFRITVKEPIFVMMLTAQYGLGDLPYHHFDNHTVIVIKSVFVLFKETVHY